MTGQKLEKMQKQADDIKDWLDENAPEVFEDQKHLDEGTEARAYWHFGRLITIQDAIRALSH